MERERTRDGDLPEQSFSVSHLSESLYQVFCHAASKPALLKECVRVLKVDPLPNPEAQASLS